jgi:hypothetical protein
MAMDENHLSSWRDRILGQFTPQLSRLTLVADPDGLLLEEGVLHGIRERGFELIPFDDHIAFRYAYESRLRSRWDNGEKTELVVVLRSSLPDLGSLPYDLLHVSRQLSFSIGELFPSLSYPVVASIDKCDLDTLFKAQEEHTPGTLADSGTKDFILRHVFGIAPEVIREDSDLLRVLLRRHYQGLRMPKNIDDYFVKILKNKKIFDDWQLEKIVPDKEAFLAFLQERWAPFVESTLIDDVPRLATLRAEYDLKIDGPVLLPFGHDDVRIYIDNLFAEGLLHPVSTDKRPDSRNTWLAIGIRDESNGNVAQRIKTLLASIEDAIPGEDARYQDWLQFAGKWAELRSIQHLHQSDSAGDMSIKTLPDMGKRVAGRFGNWVLSRYPGLYNQAPIPPVMVHHIPRALSRWRQDEGARIALLVLDGLALDQWITIRSILAKQLPAMIVREQCLFAWAPTVTSVSRQAIFAGKIPLYFPDSILTNHKEEALWRAYWSDHGLSPRSVAYIGGVHEKTHGILLSMATEKSIEVLGVVIDTVDKISHGMQLGARGMHNQVMQWAENGFLAEVVGTLLDNGFTVALTSDHGNTEATGIGRPGEGAIADMRGERARVYTDPTLRSKVKSRFPETIEWPPTGLPDNFLPLLAPEGAAFVGERERIVTHGGISIEELIVPFVKFERKKT